MNNVARSQRIPLRTDAGEFSSAIDRTIDAAFGLAMRILGEPAMAGAACESAYLETWRNANQPVKWDHAADLAFLGRVRADALRIRAGSRGPGADVPQPLEPGELGRRALDLCHYGGLSAADAAGLLGESPADVRAAIRALLLGSARPGATPQPSSVDPG